MSSETGGRLSASVQTVRERTPDSLSRPTTILVIDDNLDVAHAIRLAFVGVGHIVDMAATPEDAFSILARRRYDAILLDLNFTQGQSSGVEGFACLARILADDPAAAVVVITAHSGVRIAVAAMQTGALDFVMKPWRNTDLIARVEAAIAKRLRPATPLEAGPQIAAGQPRLLGECPAIVETRAIIRKIAPTSASVLITGPSGAGRGLVAELIHEGSPFADDPATTIDIRDPEAWERIDSATGTLILRYLDELDEVAQDRLLGRLPVQSRRIAIVDAPARLTSRLRNAVGTIELALPPLWARGDDALLLARHFASMAAERYAKRLPLFTASAESVILSIRWHDDVRGLAQAVERAVLLDDIGAIDGAALATRLVQEVTTTIATAAAAPLDISLWDSERVMIEAALRHHGHNVSKAAAALGLSRPALYRRMTRYGL